MAQQHSLMELINPFPRQEEFLQATNDYDFTLYGGAAGGGKSRILRWACIYWLIRWFKDYGKRGIVAGLFCETFRDLEDRQIVKAKEEFPEWLGRWSGYDFILSDSLGGGMICFRNLDDPTKYRSVEYALMAVDEITLTKPDTFEYLVFSRLRWPGIERTKFMAATNPGGISHLYFKCLWIDREFPERMRHLESQFKYIKALPTDNPYNTKSYFEKLKALEPNLRRALLEGDWNSFTGQVFGEFRTDIHVVEPFAIPPWWKRWRSNDPGFNDPGVWHWFAVNEDGRVFCYREATFSADECGEKVPYSEQARKVVEMTSTKEELMWTVTGMDAWFKDRAKGTGKSIIDYYSLGGISGFRKPIHGAGSVMTRVGVTHEYLRPYKDHEGKTIAKLAIFNTCKKLIATLPSIPHDRVNVEEIDRNCPFNHWFDSCFVADTLVMTEVGEMRIADVLVGDMVRTRYGFRKVLRSFLAKPLAMVYTLELSDGRVLTGTADHPLYRLDDIDDWQSLGSLKPGDRVWSLPSYTMGSLITVIQTPGTDLTGFTGKTARSRCTGKSGAARTGLFQRALKFITKTKTRSTMTYPTSNASANSPTAPIMPNSTRPAKSIWTALGCCVMAGLEHLRIALKSQLLSRIGQPLPEHAATADANLPPPNQAPVSISAPMPVPPQNEGSSRSTMYQSHAKSAADFSVPTDTTPLEPVAVSVVRIYANGCAPVYDLTVEDDPEFFANGILAHNCSMGICAWHISGSQASEPTKIVPGSLAELLNHKDIYFPPKENKSPFTHAQSTKSKVN